MKSASLNEHPSIPLRPLAAAADLGPTVVIAPHQGDESLGCGGVIAALRRFGLAVWVVFVTDGTPSRSQPRADPSGRVCATRETEALAALEALDVAPSAVTLLRFVDGAVPLPGAATFAAAVDRLCTPLAVAAPATLLLPWRHDPHPDHRATWHLVQATLPTLGARPRLLGYPTWSREGAEADDMPGASEGTPWRLDIGPVLPLKLTAIMAYHSQSTDLAADFVRPWELFMEVQPERG